MPREGARAVSFLGVSRAYGSVQALARIDLEVAAGEFVALLGPSGSGKTTLLNIAAGFVAPSTGSVRLGGQDVTALPPRKRNIGMIFQSYALFPHLSVSENVAYGLRVRRRPEAEIAERLAAALRIVQLDGLGQRRIAQLSGGQQQRVALARAIVIEPDLLLMDEPLGALDRQLRKHVQLEIRRLHRELGRTTIYVTHDQEEALVMADRVGVMRHGRIEQIGTPRDLYRTPANAFVAGFLGESNLLPGRVASLSGDSAVVSLPDLGLDLQGRAAPGLDVGDAASVLVRPEAASLRPEGLLRGRVAEIVFLGDVFATRLVLPSGRDFWCRAVSSVSPPGEGTETGIAFTPEDVLVVPNDSASTEGEPTC